ncbi:MAG: hypothetical protein AB9M53_06845 [Leptothrix sp. (in: b-proteobacteria)]
MMFNGTYTAPLKAIVGGIRAKTHLAQVLVEGKSVTAYVKAFEAGSDDLLFNEVAGGWLAQQAGIGSPPGGLLWVPASALHAVFPDSQFTTIDDAVPSYACAPVGNGYGLAAVGLADATGYLLEVMRTHLLAWPGFSTCVAFDEWVANVDRHVNNLLLTAGGQLVPIDHSDCFGGPGRHDREFTRGEEWYLNRLLEELFTPEQLALPIKAGLISAAERWPEVRRRCAADLERLSPWLGEQRGLNWLQWLETRADLTAQLLCERVGMLA